MHYAKKAELHEKARRSLAVLLALLITFSMLYVGNVAKLGVEAAINSGDVLYLAVYKNDGDGAWNWISGKSELGLWTWGGDSGDGKYYRLSLFYDDVSNNGKVFQFVTDGSFTGFQVLKISGEDEKYTTRDRVTKWNDIIVADTGYSLTPEKFNNADFSAVDLGGDKNCIYLKGNDGSYSVDFGHIDRLTDSAKSVSDVASYGQYKGNEDFGSVGVGYKSGSEYKVGDTSLYPVSATFYDYLSDYEKANGWRTNTGVSGKTADQMGYSEVSRTYLHRIPFTGWNKHISDQVGSEGGNWKYPLYFGNFTTDWTDFSGYKYGTLWDKYIYPAGTTDASAYYGDTKGFMRHENMIGNYTASEYVPNGKLNNFSIFVNCSEVYKYSSIGNYSGSTHGLVMNELTGYNAADVGSGVLKMTTADGTGITSPYFTKNDYTNVVSTQFPMRINDSNTVGDGTYTTIEFDSMGKAGNAASVKPDIAYFTYDSDGKPEKMNYSNSQTMQVIDAYQTLGGNSEGDHRGFFPFDEGDGTGAKIGTDFGFGMRLDIDFNLSKNGNIVGIDKNGKHFVTDLPTMFSFAGDDDVWVFVDGKLALDLGGDHGNAEGSINFSLSEDKEFTMEKDGKTGTVPAHNTYVDNGAMTVKSDVAYGDTNYATVKASKSNDILGCFSDDSFVDATKTEYDTTKQHRLTVFYMERGIVESNLKLSFSLNPPDTNIKVEKKDVFYNGLNSAIQTRVDNAIANESFLLKTKDGVNSMYDVERSDGYSSAIEADDGLYIDKGQYYTIKNGLGDDKDVTVTEDIGSSNVFKYKTTYTVTNNVTSTTVGTASQAASNPGTDGGGSVTFTLTPTTTGDGIKKKADYTVDTFNEIKLGSVKLLKAFTGKTPTAADNSKKFKFNVYVKLPGESDFPDSPDISNIECSVNAPYTLTGIPVGSTVKFVEVGESDTRYTYNTTGNTVTVADGTVNETTVTNTINPTSVKVNAEVNATKTIDGAAPTMEKFMFKLTQLDGDNKKLTTFYQQQNNAAGAIKFSLTGLTSGETYNYILEEVAGTSTDYIYSDKLYYVEIKAGEPSVVKYYAATVSDGVYAKGTETAPTFDNKKNVGEVEVLKQDSSSSPISGIEITIAEKGSDGKPKTGGYSNTQTTGTDGKVKFTDIPAGTYIVYESKSKTGYELNGDTYAVTVTAGSSKLVTITDKDNIDLPDTGGKGVIIMIVVGVALVAAGIYLLRNPEKKKKEND